MSQLNINSIQNKFEELAAIIKKICAHVTHSHITFGFAAWGQASKTYLNKILFLQKKKRFPDTIFLRQKRSCNTSLN